MNVKKGIASSNSLESTLPKMRPGMACRKLRSKNPRLIARKPNESPSAARVKATGKPISMARNQAAEHERRHHFQRDHWVGLSYFASIVTRFCSAAMRLITSDTPCSANITKPAGTTNLIGHRSKPPAYPTLRQRNKLA